MGGKVGGKQTGQGSKPAPTKTRASEPAADKRQPSPMRIAKAIAHAGLCSRRDAERLIEAGRVAVNGKVLTTPAHVVRPDDKIMVDGKPLPRDASAAALALSQAARLVTSHKDPQGRKTVFEALPPELAARGLGRTARHQHRGLAAAHHRRRARAASRAAEHGLAQALPRARAWPRHPGGARPLCATASPSTASITGRSRRASTASKAAICGSRSRFAKARTAR